MRASDQKHAIVVGGGMAGLCACKILSTRFERVTLIERDEYPHAIAARRGVPQGSHCHALSAQGHRVLEKLFPGLEERRRRAGAQLLDWTQDFQVHLAGAWQPRFRSGLTSCFSTRPHLEHAVREEVERLANVHFRTGAAVSGLSAEGRRVAGVALKSGETLGADLVVDASGRTSALPRWLEGLGRRRPRRTVVDSHGGYAGCLFSPPPGYKPDWGIFWVMPLPNTAQTRGTLIMVVEHGLWQVQFNGRNKDYPPRDFEALMQWGSQGQGATLVELLRGAKQETPVEIYRDLENRWHHLEEVEDWPEGFVVMGEAALRTTPTYTQGLTMAALGADLLATCLDGGLEAADFQKRLAALMHEVWVVATGDDWLWPGTTGDAPDPAMRTAQHQYQRFKRAASADPVLRKLLWEIRNLTRPLSTILESDVLSRTIAAEGA